MPFKKKRAAPAAAVQTAPRHPFAGDPFTLPQWYASAASFALYDTLRTAVPIIDAAVGKLVRLTLGFEAHCKDGDADRALQDFIQHVPLGGCGCGVPAFLSAYLDQLLTYGTAIGEIVVQNGQVMGLYNAPLRCIELRRAADGFSAEVLAGDPHKTPVPYPDLLLLSALRPAPGALYGTSLLHGLPFVTSILLKIFTATGENWDRLGNVRFAVTYKPQNDAIDRAWAKERAMQVAKEWSEAMQSGAHAKDFVTVGDVSIRAIGADCPIPDCEVPVRQMLEQILAKTGLPPFLLGLSWSSTERMSAQQADLLTSELEAYRALLTPVLQKILRTFLRLSGSAEEPQIVWNDVTLQDEVELSRARLYDAQAKKLLQSLEKEADT
ncbi:MAG: serine/threonine protein phosphatase [Clostridia bacterium]|nr:serine/threonine protein phosphatase [Clostridia bacterium]